MLIKTIFYRELVNNAIKIFVVLMFLLPLTELFKVLDQATSGQIPTTMVFTFMFFGTIASFPVIINISIFLSILLTFNRFSKDQELIIWSSSGISPFFWLKLITFFALPFAFIAGFCAMSIKPWATEKTYAYSEYATKQKISSFIAPGVFKEAPDGKVVFYVESYSLSPSYAKNIFIKYLENDNNEYVATGKFAKIDDSKDIIELLLKDGNRYSLNDKDNFTNIHFNSLIANIPKEKGNIEKTKNEKTYGFIRLIKLDNNVIKVELLSRINEGIVLFLMALLTLPLSIQVGRMQHNYAFILVPFAYAIYNNILFSLNVKINNNEISSFWILIIHIIVLLIAIILTFIKSYPKGYFFNRKNKK